MNRTASSPVAARLADLVAVLDTLGAVPADEAAHRAGEALAPVIADVEWLPDVYRRVPPGHEEAVYLLQAPADRSWCVLAVVWKGEAATPVHDHVVWGASGQLIGRLVEVRYQRIAGDEQRVRSHSAVLHQPGDVSTVVPPFDVHRVSNPDAETAVAIQVFGRDLSVVTRHAFDLERGITVVRVTVYDGRV